MKKKILVVEDHPDVRDILVFQLRHMGYDTVVADNGALAVKLAIEESPDAIILDLRLPELNGVEVAAMLKNHLLASTIPILVYTGLETGEWRERAFKAGAREYLTKPISPSLLRERIEKLTEERVLH